MNRRIIIFLALTCTLLYAQEPQNKTENLLLQKSEPLLLVAMADRNHENKESLFKLDNKNNLPPYSRAEVKRTTSLTEKSSNLGFRHGEPLFTTVPTKLERIDFNIDYNNQHTKLEKFALSQLLFAGMGAVDYAIKEAPMYPGHREDTFFWQSAWGGMVWGSSVSLNFLVVKDAKYLLGLLTEDMSYYLCRSIFHKQSFPEQFGLPMRILGADQVPMKTMIIIWAASLTYLALDALDIL